MIYFVLLFILIIVASLQSYRTQRNLSIFIMFSMCLLCGMRREDVCIDTSRYFDYAERGTYNSRFGEVFDFLCNMNLSVGGDGYTFLLLVAVLTYIPLLVIMLDREYVKRPALFLLLFYFATPLFFQETFNIVRQMLGTSYFILGGYLYFKKDMPFKRMYRLSLVVLCFLIAAYTHRMLLTVMPLFFLSALFDFRLTKKKVGGIIAFAVIFGSMPFWDALLRQGMVFLSATSISGTENAGIDFDIYLTDNIYSGKLNIIGILSSVLPFAFFGFFSYTKDKEYDRIYQVFFLGVVLYCLLVQSVFCRRLTIPLTIFMLMYIPNVWERMKSSKTLISLVLTYMIYHYFTVLIEYNNDINSIGVLPYYFNFQ